MKFLQKLAAIITLITILGFVACDDGGSDSKSSSDNSAAATWGKAEWGKSYWNK